MWSGKKVPSNLLIMLKIAFKLIMYDCTSTAANATPYLMSWFASAELGEALAHVADGLLDSLLVLDEREADEALAPGTEARSG